MWYSICTKILVEPRRPVAEPGQLCHALHPGMPLQAHPFDDHGRAAHLNEQLGERLQESRVRAK
eukprot:1788432-Lingulodinium_polyedra.AAC.1